MQKPLQIIVLYLKKKGLTPEQIHKEINETLGPKTIAYSTVTKYFRKELFASDKKTSENIDKKMIDEKNQILVENALKIFPFASVREIAKMTGIPKSSVYRVLTEQLNYVNRHLKWIPHSLNSSQLIQRKDLSNELLNILKQYKRNNYNLFYTGDESWFYLNTDYNQQWLPEGETPSNKIKKMIDSKKYMLTIFWNPNGFILVEALDDNTVFNAEYFINEILEQINFRTASDREKIKKKLVLHYDNARPHISKKVLNYLEDNDIIRAPQPPYSPDIAPSDFYLFGYIKQKLQGCKFESVDQLLGKVNEILEDISTEVLKKVFLEWERRLRQVIESDGNYIQ